MHLVCQVPSEADDRSSPTPGLTAQSKQVELLSLLPAPVTKETQGAAPSQATQSLGADHSQAMQMGERVNGGRETPLTGEAGTSHIPTYSNVAGEHDESICLHAQEPQDAQSGALLTEAQPRSKRWPAGASGRRS